VFGSSISIVGLSTAYADWFDSVNSAVNSGANHVILTAGVNYPDDGTVMNYATDGFLLDGGGLITVKAGRTGYLFDTSANSEEIKIRNILIDGNRAVAPDYDIRLINFNGAHTVEKIIVDGCILTSGSYNIHVASVTVEAIITNNIITDIAPHDGVTLGNMGQGIGTSSAEITKLIITNNIVSGPPTISADEGPEGIFIYDGTDPTDAISEVIITGNTVDYCGANAAGNIYSSIDLYHGAATGLISENKIKNYTYIGIRAAGGINSEVIINNNIVKSPVHPTSHGINSCAVNCIISGNIIKDANSYGIMSSGYDNDPQYGSEVIISENIIKNSGTASIYTRYIENLTVSKNSVTSPAADISSIYLRDVSNAGGDGILNVSGNSIIGNITFNNNNGIYITGDCNVFSISQNIIKDVGATGIYAVPSAQTSGSIKGNIIDTAVGYGIRTLKEKYIDISENTIRNTTLDPYHENCFLITSNGVALNVFGHSDLDSSDNAVNSTLADGQIPGQIKTIRMTNASNSSTVTVAKHETESPEIFTFADVSDFLELIWTGAYWSTVKNIGVDI